MASRRWTDEQLVAAIRESKTKSEALRKLGLAVRPGNYRTIEAHIRRLGLDCSHMSGMAHGSSVPVNEIPIELLLVEHSPIGSSHFKKKLLKGGLIENKCAECKCDPVWRGVKLVLVLDHINGVHDDNRLENLRFLCPNCNSQQPTFCRGATKMLTPRTCSLCGRRIVRRNKTGLCHRCRSIDKRRAERPSADVLRAQIETLGFRGTGKFYGVSDNAVRKWLKHAEG